MNKETRAEVGGNSLLQIDLKSRVKGGPYTVKLDEERQPTRANIQEREPGSPNEAETRYSGKWHKHVYWEAQRRLSKVTFTYLVGHSYR